jgi:hypothetical protein
LLDHQLLNLPGGVLNLSSASNPQVLLYQYGTAPDRLSQSAPGCLRIGIRLDSSKRTDFKPVNVQAATVSYTQLDGSTRTTWIGNFLPGDASSQLTLDATAVGGKLTFQVKGVLLNSGSGGFGTSSGGNQMFVDWTMKDLSTALPVPPSADPNASPSPDTSSGGSGGGWTRL